MELNREQIVKALESCVEDECDACPFDEITACKQYLLHSSISLIKELTEENERLRDLVIEVQQYNEAWVEDNGKLRREIEKNV